MPWKPTSTHPDAANHQGYPITITEDGQRIRDEGTPGVSRVVECSCGWIGTTLDAPAGTAATKEDRSLLVRRQRRQDRGHLQPEWEQHVSQWVPDELPFDSDAPAPTAATTQSVQETTVTPEPAREPHQADPAPETSAEDPVRSLYVRAREADEANRRAHDAGEALTVAVKAARAAGLSWAKVAAATGTSKQAAWERWRTL